MRQRFSNKNGSFPHLQKARPPSRAVSGHSPARPQERSLLQNGFSRASLFESPPQAENVFRRVSSRAARPFFQNRTNGAAATEAAGCSLFLEKFSARPAIAADALLSAYLSGSAKQIPLPPKDGLARSSAREDFTFFYFYFSGTVGASAFGYPKKRPPPKTARRFGRPQPFAVPPPLLF